MQLKPQDLLVSLKLIACAGRRWTYASLAQELGLSASEVHACVKRGLQAGLLMEPAASWPAVQAPESALLSEPGTAYHVGVRPRRARRSPVRPGSVHDAGAADDNPVRAHEAHLAEFAVHGARYAFAAVRQPGGPGVPTGLGVMAVVQALGLPEVGGGADAWVWPHPQGPAQGEGVEPLHPSAPYAALQDEKLHEMLALLDLLRLGEPGLRSAAARRLHALIDRASLAPERGEGHV